MAELRRHGWRHRLRRLLWIAFLWRPGEFGRFTLFSTEKDPVPALQLFLYWIVTGAVSGAVIAVGYHLWLGTRGSVEYGAWVSKAGVKNLLVVAGVSWLVFALMSATSFTSGWRAMPAMATASASGAPALPDGW